MSTRMTALPQKTSTRSWTPVRPGLLQRKCACGGTPGPSGECEECRKKRLQRQIGNSETNNRNNSLVPPIVHEVLRSPGQPLDAATRAFMEPRFGHDFSQVRVHTDKRAMKSARDVNALAYTVGQNIVFGEGNYSPTTSGGWHLLAHELTHTVQQSKNGTASLAGSASISESGDPAEQEAEAIAEKVSLANGSQIVAGDILPVALAVQRLGGSSPITPPNGTEEKKDVCIRPVQIADDDGKNATALPSFAESQTIWGKCCINLSINGAAKVSKTAYKELDESPTDIPTSEEKALFAAAGASGGCISVFVADTFRQGGRVSKDVSGGGGTYESGKAEPKIVVVEGVHPTIVAHEMGHAMGYLLHGPAGTVMEVTASRHDQKESDKVAKPICDKVRTFTSSKGSGKKECNLSV